MEEEDIELAGVEKSLEQEGLDGDGIRLAPLLGVTRATAGDKVVQRMRSFGANGADVIDSKVCMRTLRTPATTRVVMRAIDALAMCSVKDKLALFGRCIVERHREHTGTPTCSAGSIDQGVLFGMRLRPGMYPGSLRVRIRISAALVRYAAICTGFLRMRCSPHLGFLYRSVLMRVVPAFALRTHLLRVVLAPLALIVSRCFRISVPARLCLCTHLFCVGGIAGTLFGFRLVKIARSVCTLLCIDFVSIGFFPGTKIGKIAGHTHFLSSVVGG